ncbi:MAG: SPASM domain-containing protein, partial [Anaerolineales bacterium]|nr:SPASM domain-containing protein [Anaerolineales bacterium]
LKYAGGEATLHFKLVRQLHDYAFALSAQTGLALKEVVLSNGVYLRPEDAAWLAENSVKLMISLDGIGELHDRLRPVPVHTPFNTFERVAATIDTVLLLRGIRLDITMTVTAVNAHGAADVAKWAMIDRDLPTSFNFYRQNPLSASRTDLALEEQAIINGMLAAYDVIEQHLPERPFLNGLLDRVQTQAHTHTCGVSHSYLVISHTGRLSQCQMQLDHPVADTLNDDLLMPVQQGSLHNISVHEKEGCRTCAFRYRCSGGCPLETYRATGRWDVQSPNCHIYKTLYPAALRLEGLRLMKQHGCLQ